MIQIECMALKASPTEVMHQFSPLEQDHFELHCTFCMLLTVGKEMS